MNLEYKSSEVVKFVRLGYFCGRGCLASLLSGETLSIISQELTELIFGATAETGGRVKMLSTA